MKTGNLLKLILLMIPFNVLFSQEITVIDQLTQQRIPSARIFSNAPVVKLMTDADGRFRLEPFAECDSVYIAYPNYKTLGFTLGEIKVKRWVELSDNTLSINELVVTANRWEQNRSQVPFRINTLHLKELEIQSPQTSADLLEEGGSVYVQKSQQAGGSPQLRGYGTNRVLIVVDGVRMNNAIFRSGNLQNVIAIDPNSLESVEVLFGPGAVRYGSDAIGGVMDFTTKATKFALDETKKLVKSNLYSRFSSSNQEITNHVDLQFGSKKWAFVTTATYARFGDLKAGKYGDSSFFRPSYQSGSITQQTNVTNEDPSLQIGSGYNQLNAIQKVSFKPNKAVQLDYAFIYSESSNAPRYDRLIQDNDNNDTLDYFDWYYGPQRWIMNSVSTTITKKNVLFDHAKAIVANQIFDESRHDLKAGSTTYRRQFEKVNVWSVNADFDKHLGERSNVFYGLEYLHNKVSSKAYREELNGERTIQNSRYPDGSIWQAVGGYINLEHHLSDKFVINSGIRFTYYKVSMEFDTTLFPYPYSAHNAENAAVNGSLGLVYNPVEHAQYYVNFSTGFRAPNIDDMAKVFDSQPGNVVVPNVNLKSEYAYNGELGFNITVKDVLRIDGAVYASYLDHALSLSPFTIDDVDSMYYEGAWSKIYAIQNLSHAYVYGFQAGLEILIAKGFSLISNINYQQGQEFNADSLTYYPKSHVAPLFGRTALKFKTRHLQLVFSCEYQGEMDAVDLPLVEREEIVYAKDAYGRNYAPAWYTLNFKAAYFFNKHVALNAGVENITNQLYRTYGSGISASGRNFIVSLKLSL